MRMLVLATRVTDPDRGDPAPRELLLRALVEAGHEPHLVCEGDEPMRSAGELTVHPVHADRAGVVPAFSSRSFAAAARCRPGAVIAERAHLALGWAIAARTGAAFVPLMESSSSEGSAWHRGLRQAVEARFVRGSEACLSVDPAAADEARRLGAARVLELPGVSSLTGQPPTRTGWLRRHLGLGSGLIALAWGPLSPEHGTDALIEGVKVAADADADVHAVIFGGDAPSIGRYEAKAQRLGIDHRVHLLGSWPASRLATLLVEADILVETSTSLAPPPALYTFLASGRPLVLAEAPLRDRLVPRGACRAAPADRLGVGDALAHLAESEPLRAQISEAAADHVRRHHSYDAFRTALGPIEKLAAAGVAPESA